MRPPRLPRPRAPDRGRFPWFFLGVAALSAGCLLALYVVAFGTALGRRADDRTARDVDALLSSGWPDALTDVIKATVTDPAIAVLVTLVIGYAVLRRRFSSALFVAALIVGSGVATYVTKRLLGALDPFGGEAQRRLAEHSFPSGHSTFAMSVALALIVVVDRERLAFAALAGGGWASAVGVVALTDLAHYPSDVAGGYLMAAAWATALAGYRGLGRGLEAGHVGASSPGTVWRRPTSLLSLLLLGGATGSAIVLALGHPRVLSYVSATTASMAAGAALVALCLLLVLSFAFLLASARGDGAEGASRRPGQA